MDKTALILVDIQNDYFPGGKMTLEGVEPACANAARLLQHFRDKRLPIFHIRHLAVQPNATFFCRIRPEPRSTRRWRPCPVRPWW